MFNWIVWNKTIYMYKNGFSIKITYNGWYAIKPNQTKQKQIEQTSSCLLAQVANDYTTQNANIIILRFIELMYIKLHFYVFNMLVYIKLHFNDFMCWFSLIPLFNGISTLLGYLLLKLSL